jgi:hypothetical protein
MMTTISDRAVREGSLPAVAQAPESTAETRACARASQALPSPAAPVPVTDRARTAGAALARAAGRAAEYLDRPGSLVHAQPPTFARAREQHLEAAARHDIAPVRHLRLIWGYAHLLIIKPVLNGLEWVTETPARFLIAVIVVVIVYFFS